MEQTSLPGQSCDECLENEYIFVYHTPSLYVESIPVTQQHRLSCMTITTYEGTYPGGTRVRGRVATERANDGLRVVESWNHSGYRYGVVDVKQVPLRWRANDRECRGGQG